MTIQEFKHQLNHVFDDDLHTKQWENYVDYAIIGLIVLSTLQIFLSTFDYMDQHFGTLLRWIDYITIVIFTIEVTLRIWCADLLDEKYRGFMGRVRYCFSFYGLIDFVSTYSFYVALFFPIPYNILKVLRVARLLRIFRYMKAFTILNRAISSKKDEMTVSLQFLIIVTLMLSFILFFVEHEAQPDVYSNGWTSVVWAFAQYIGDPGNFADTPPITVTGRLIACIIGILGIAIFAVPAGLIASGFSDSMAEMKAEEVAAENARKIRSTFYIHSRKLLMGYKFWPQTFEEMNELKSTFGLTEDDIFAAVNSADDMRIIAYKNGFAVELLHVNTSYGYCSKEETVNFPETNSSVTIVSHNGATNSGITYCAYELARIGRFNLVANEFLSSNEDNPENRAIVLGFADYQYNDQVGYPKLHEFISDIKHFVKDEKSWVICVSRNCDREDVSVGLKVHVDKKSDDNTIEDCNTVNDAAELKSFYEDLKSQLIEKHNVETFLNFQIMRHVCGRVRKWGLGANAIELQFSKGLIEDDDDAPRGIAAFKTIEEVIHRHFESINTDWNTENWGSKEASKYSPTYETQTTQDGKYAWAEIKEIHANEMNALTVIARRIRKEFNPEEEVAIVYEDTEQRAVLCSVKTNADGKLEIQLTGISSESIHPGMFITNNLHTKS